MIKGDGAHQELAHLQDVLLVTEQKVALKDSIIVTKDKKIDNLNTIILKKDEQFNLQKSLSKELEKALKASNRRVFFYKFGTYGGLVAGLLLLVK